MISREDLNTITRNRAESFQPSRYMSASAIRSAEISEEIEKFISKGGKIESIPFGVSAINYDVSLPLKTIKEMEIARKRVAHRFPAGRPRQTAEESEKTFIGAECGYDGNRVRYRSNGACKVCSMKRYNERKAARDAKAN